ncbi:hypothetical protein AKJ45_03235 [candidate division MSBL1 archaeon SCGC-AAA261F19]|uniref:Cation/H+ exchanger transmembrane domain-containing protein n=1 Tax=candidate division MSBL1 archaeon SCGC-AAA261F19 TaxID=1698275 RepID=A0A133V8L8_9EURY|nr:hypothetical protein AKJ45_03235 [candidate division MSBL1 archaeon SCGC-AAA261F19]
MTLKLPIFPFIIKSSLPALLIVLVVAIAGRLLSHKLNQPAILGELVLGMLLGNIVILADPVKDLLSSLAEIGIMLLLFFIGLTIDFDEFKGAMKTSGIVAAGGIILPFILGYFITIFFGFNHIIALFVGTALIATSVGISTSILEEFKMLRTRVGSLITGAAVIDDVIGVIIMSALIGMAATGVFPLPDIFITVCFTIAFFLLSLTLVVRLLERISKDLHLRGENLLMLGLVIALFFGLITSKIGLATIIGAFVGGLVIGQTRFAKNLKVNISIIGGSFFIPIFFVTLGMNFDVSVLYSAGPFMAALVVTAFVGKIVGCGFGAKAFNFDNKESLTVGLAMIPRAEVALIIARFGYDGGWLEPDIFSAIIVMVIITSLATPPLLGKCLRTFKTIKVGQSEKT